MRGVLTEEVRKVMIENGFEGNVRELRLMPYIVYCLLDNIDLEPSKITPEERSILASWKGKGYLSGISSEFGVTEDFFNRMINVLKIGYLSEMFFKE